MRREELLDIPLNDQAVQGSNQSSILRRRVTLVSLIGFVFVLGAVCAFCVVKPVQPEQMVEGQIINRKMHNNLMQQYSRVLSVEVTPNAAKVPKDSQFHKKIQSENMVLNFYPISRKPQIIAIEVVDQQEMTLNKDISEISYSDFNHDVHRPLSDVYFLVLHKGQFSKLVVDQKVSEQQLDKIKHIVQQYTPELDSSLYQSPKQYVRSTKLGQAKVQHQKVFEDSNKVVVKHAFNGDDIAKTSSFQNLDKNTYQFEQTHHFSKETNSLTHSDLHENYSFETSDKDMFMLGMGIQTHQKLELLKTREVSAQKQQELMAKYYAMEDTSKQVLTLNPNELKHTKDFEFAQSVKDQLFPEDAGCPIKERILQANDNIQTLTNQTFTVYNHPQQSFLGFSFQIIDEIAIYLDLTNKTLIFDNSLVLQIQRDSCFKQFTLIEFTLPMTTNFTFDMNYIEASAEAWLENLEDFFTGIYSKFQDFLKKIKAEGIHSNSSWTGIDQNNTRELSLKSDLDQFEQDLSKWNGEIIEILSHTSKQYHYSKPISYEYNLEFYGITLQFSFGFTFGLDGSYTDNLLDLYTYDKQVLISYIDLLVQDYQTDMEQIQGMWKNLTALLAGCMNSDQLTKEEEIMKNWQCSADDSELDYVCKNNRNSQEIHITKMYHDYMQSKRKNVASNECITQEITQLEQQIQNQLKQFYDLRQSKFLNLINLTYIPQFHGDVYVTGFVKVTLVPWLNNLAMSISVSGDLLNAVADLSLQVDVKPFFMDLIQLVEEDISSYQFLQDVESSVSFNFNFDVQVVNVTLTWVADTAVVDFVLDVAEVMKDMWSQHRLRELPATTQDADVSKFQDIFSDAASKFEQGLEKVIADIYCEFFTNAQGITEAFSPETVPLYQFLWASAGCNLPSATLANFQTSMIQCSYTTDFQVVQLWDPSKYQ